MKITDCSGYFISEINRENLSCRIPQTSRIMMKRTIAEKKKITKITKITENTPSLKSNDGESGELLASPVFTPNPIHIDLSDFAVNLDGTLDGYDFGTRSITFDTTYPLSLDGDWRFILMANEVNGGKFDQSVSGTYWYMEDEKYRWFKLHITGDAIIYRSPTTQDIKKITDTGKTYRYTINAKLLRGSGRADDPQALPERPLTSEAKLLFAAEWVANTQHKIITALTFSLPTPKYTIPTPPIDPPTGVALSYGVDGKVDGITWQQPSDAFTYIYAVKPSEWGDVYLTGPVSANAKKVTFIPANVPAPGETVFLRIIVDGKNYDSALLTVPGGGDPGAGIEPTGIEISPDGKVVTWEAPVANDVYMHAYVGHDPVGKPTAASEGQMIFVNDELTAGKIFRIQAVRGSQYAWSGNIPIPHPPFSGDPGGQKPEAGGEETLRPKNVTESRPQTGKLTLKWSNPSHTGGGTASIRGWVLGVDSGIIFDYTHHNTPREVTCVGAPGTRVRVVFEQVSKPNPNKLGWSKIYTI